MGDIKFNYYYGNEAEQFSFYRVPRILIKDERFKGLTSDAKLLYGLMLDRLSLSMKNGWFDDQNRAYIIYTIENVIEDLGCGRDKAIKVLKELDKKTGIGLIEKVRQGLGKPDIIFVKNFCISEEINHCSKSNFQKSEKPTSEEMTYIEEADTNSDNQAQIIEKNTKSCLFVVKSGGLGNSTPFPEVGKTDFKKYENPMSGSMEIRLPEVGNPASNYTDTNHTEESYNNQTNQPRENMAEMSAEEIMAYRELISDNLAIGKNSEDYTEEWLEYVNEMYELICDIVLVPRKSITIDKVEYPYQVVRSRFLNLTREHVDYVIDSIKHYKGKISNIKGFAITALYNAPTSCNLQRTQSIYHTAFGGNE